MPICLSMRVLGQWHAICFTHSDHSIGREQIVNPVKLFIIGMAAAMVLMWAGPLVLELLQDMRTWPLVAALVALGALWLRGSPDDERDEKSAFGHGRRRPVDSATARLRAQRARLR